MITTTAAAAVCSTSMAVAMVVADTIIKAAALSSPPEVEVEEGKRVRSTSRMAIAVRPTSAAAMVVQ